jgi:hypothetical protein
MGLVWYVLTSQRIAWATLGAPSISLRCTRVVINAAAWACLCPRSFVNNASCYRFHALRLSKQRIINGRRPSHNREEVVIKRFSTNS